MIILLYALFLLCLLCLVFWNEDSGKCDKNLKKSKKFNVIDRNIPPQNFLLTDPNGNISTMNFGTTALNSNMTVNGIISTDGISSTGNISTGGITSTRDISATGNISATNEIIVNNSGGNVTLRGGDPASNNIAGHVNFYKKNGDRKGFIGWGTGGDNDYISMYAEHSRGFMINSGKEFCIGSQCLTEDDIRRLKAFLANLQNISTSFSYLKQRGGKNDGNSTMNGIGGNSDSKWAACLSDFFQDLQSLFNI